MPSEDVRPHPLGGARATRAPVGSVQLRCAECRTPTYVADEAKRFQCAACDAANVFYTCEHCQAALMVPGPDGQSPTRWACGSCGQVSTLPRFGPLPVLTAAQFYAAGGGFEAEDSVAEPAITQITGFSILVSYRTGLPVGMTCAVIAMPEGVTVQMPDGPRAALAMRYEDLDVLEIGGHSGERRERSEDPDDGAAVRGILRTTDRSPGECVLRLAGGGKTLVLAHPTRSREQVESTFAEMLERWRSLHRSPLPARPDEDLTPEEAIAQLERLTALYQAGGITDLELEAMRAPLIWVLTGRARIVHADSRTDRVG